MLRISQREWMNIGLNITDKNVANELQFVSIRFARIFAGVYCKGVDEPE